MQDLIGIYRELSRQSDYALHLGLTEAGMGSKGIVASTAAMAVLLQEGIGDTIRVSLTPEPGGQRTQEVVVAQENAADDGAARFHADGYRLPRLRADDQHLLPELAQRIQNHVREKMPRWREEPDRREHDAGGHGLRGQWPGREQARQHRHQPAGNRRGACSAGLRGCVKTVILRGENIADEFTAIVDRYVARTYTRKNVSQS